LPTSFFLTNYLTDINLDIYQKRSCDILIVVISHTGVTNKRNKIYHEFNIFKSGEDLVALLFFSSSVDVYWRDFSTWNNFLWFAFIYL